MKNLLSDDELDLVCKLEEHAYHAKGVDRVSAAKMLGLINRLSTKVSDLLDLLAVARNHVEDRVSQEKSAFSGYYHISRLKEMEKDLKAIEAAVSTNKSGA